MHRLLSNAMNPLPENSRPWAPRSAAAALFLSAVSLAFALDPAKDLLQYNCQTWTRQNGLPVNGIKTITQSKDGYLWLGTAAGLLRFDGREFNLLDLAQVPGIRSSIVASVANANDGGLWVGLENGSFGYYDGRTFSLRGKEAWGGLSLDVRSVMETKDGTLWLASQREAARITPAGRYEPVMAISDAFTFNLLFHFADSRGRHWLATAEEGLHYWQDGKLVRFPDPAVKSILGMAEDPAGNLWIGGPDGLHCYDSDLRQKEVPALAASVRTLMVDRRGILWAGTDGLGLVRYQHGAYGFFRKSDGLASDYVNRIMEDSEGSLWVGTIGGLSQLRDVKFAAENPARDDTDAVAMAVGPSARGGAWVAGSAGVTYFGGTTRQTYSTLAGLPAASVKRVFEARNGDVYLVSGLTTLVILSGEKVAAIHPAPTLVVGMVEDATSVIVSVGGSLYRAGKDFLTPYVFTGATPNFNWILNLAPGRDGAFWVASERGIFRVKDGTFQQWSVAEGLPEPVTRTIVEDGDGSVWASTLSAIVRLKDNKISRIGRKDGLFDDNIYALVPDDLGNFWIDSGRGIYRVSRQAMNDFADGNVPRVEFLAYDGSDSVTTTDKSISQERVGCKSLDGRIWFPSAKGVVIIDPAHIPINRIPPSVHLDRVLANREEVDRHAAAAVPPGQGELAIHFAVLSFAAPQRVKIRFQLEGYDRDWIETDSRREAFYTNLRPGRYVFRVTAANADGVWNNTGDALEIGLRPHFYQTPWFYLLGGGLALGGLLGIYRWRTGLRERKEQALRENRLLLETEVRSRTAELQQENTERKHAEAKLANSLSLLHATLESTIDGILVIDQEGRLTTFNRTFAEMWCIPLEILATRDSERALGIALAQLKDPAAFTSLLRKLSTQPAAGSFDVLEMKDGRIIERFSQPHRVGQVIVGRVVCFRDITSRKQAEAKLVETHKELLDTSHRAGMAEVATGVLHNVGNVLNSLNVSASVIATGVRQSKADSLTRLATLLHEHAADLGEFLTSDPKGKRVPELIASLASHLGEERSRLLVEITSLQNNIDHIKEIVTRQQAYATVVAIVEPLEAATLMDEAVHLNSISLLRHEVKLVREFHATPPILVEKGKVLQILINLIRNARHACDDAHPHDGIAKVITVRVEPGVPGFVRLSVQDNGVGIPMENLTRIFQHGFTTKATGHGFGLHSSANAAREMKGSLAAHSDGPGTGATFILTLPVANIPAQENQPPPPALSITTTMAETPDLLT